jgi:hypothetical protein
MVLAWNDVLLQAIRNTSLNPPRASRAMAIVHAAIYDAVNSIDRTHQPYLVQLLPHPEASLDAAVASAALTTLKALFPASQHAAFDTAYSTGLAGVPDGKSETDGVNLGKAVAAQILAIRATDGSTQTSLPYTGGTDPGEWRPTAPANAAGLLPFWGTVTPFVMDEVDDFQADPPPALTDDAYTTAYNEVKLLGVKTGSTRTEDQTNIALFWANGAGTSTPPGHWNVIAQIVAAAEGNTLIENARLFCMLNLGLADAAITCWDTKYEFNFWRPITAIHTGDADTNDLTAGDTAWEPLLVTPPFPGYTSGHSTFSGVAATILAGFFGSDDIAFTAPSEAMGVPDRDFDSFSEAAEESAISRMYGGIHFSFDNQEGLELGYELGEFVISEILAPASQAAIGLVDNEVRIFGTDERDVLTLLQVRGRIRVLSDGHEIGNYDAKHVFNIVIDSCGGSDAVTLSLFLSKPTEVYAGDGNDRVSGSRGRDRIFGEGGDDILFGNDGADYLDGGDGHDFLSGDRGKDVLRGGIGNDWLLGGIDLDDLDGGPGINRVFQ